MNRDKNLPNDLWELPYIAMTMDIKKVTEWCKKNTLDPDMVLIYEPKMTVPNVYGVILFRYWQSFQEDALVNGAIYKADFDKENPVCVAGYIVNWRNK